MPEVRVSFAPCIQWMAVGDPFIFGSLDSVRTGMEQLRAALASVAQLLGDGLLTPDEAAEMKAAAMQDFALARYATRGWLRRGSEVCGISKTGTNARQAFVPARPRRRRQAMQAMQRCDVERKQLEVEGLRKAQSVELEGKREAHCAAAAAIREGMCACHQPLSAAPPPNSERTHLIHS